MAVRHMLPVLQPLSCGQPGRLLQHPAKHLSRPLCRQASSQGEYSAEGDVVLVTGGNGFLGQHVIKQLHENAPHVREIRVLDKDPFEQKLDYNASKRTRMHIGSVTNAEFVKRCTKGVDSVIHIAGLVSYGTFPDFKGMEEVNVQGTNNVIKACFKHDVTRLIYCSTVDVVIGFEPIRGGTELRTFYPWKMLFPGYPDTKLKAERNVLDYNGKTCPDGETLYTMALRANVMYGELDPYYVTSALRSAKSFFGILPRIGDGQAQFQQCYVGNAAAAFVQADAALRDNPKIGGHFFFIPDDTPLQNSFDFMEPYLKQRGYKLSRVAIPFKLAYNTMYMMELLLKALSPLVKVHLKQASCSIQYVNMDLHFSYDKAKRLFNYTPPFSPEQAQERSMSYYRTVRL